MTGVNQAATWPADQLGPQVVGSVTGPASRAVTIRLLPQGGK